MKRIDIKFNFSILSLVAVLGLVSCGTSLPEAVAEEYETLPKQLDFNIHVKPILSDKCYACHGPDKGNIKGGLQLHTAEAAFAELPENPGRYAIVPGKLDKSEFYHRIMTDDQTLIMPEASSHLKLSDYEKAVLIKWMEDGAEYKNHWAFITPEEHEIPKVGGETANPIDNFVLAKLKEEGLAPSKNAAKEILLRRASLDLIGLPPTVEELEAFVNDTSTNAFEKQIDRLLASDHYGEQRALDWMDVARYADTNGYSNDTYRDTSPWRDWVIKVFNQNMPYDKFLEWQIAGDMFEGATKEQKLATTFNRLHPQNIEGGIIDEEFRSEYVADRTATVSQGILGLSYACAKCHDHKYDPISQENYFQLYSFFNNVDETGLIPWDRATPVPAMLLPTKEQEKTMANLKSKVDDAIAQLGITAKSESQKAEDWIAANSFKKVNANKMPKGLVAAFDFNKGKLVNTNGGNGKSNIQMKNRFVDNRKANFVEGYKGKGLKLDGDDWLDLDKIGGFRRNQPFTVGVRVWIPKDLKEGVVFHSMISTELHSYRGLSLSIKENNKIEAMLAHVYPDNSITVQSLDDMPREKWVHLTMTYDGSSKANGIGVYLDGNKLKTKTRFDNLYKDIIFHNYKPYWNKKKAYESPIQFGAVWRDKGLRDCIIDDITVFNKELSTLEVKQVENPKVLKSVIEKNYADLSDTEKQDLINYYLSNESKSYKNALANVIEQKLPLIDTIDNIQQIMVMKESDNPRQTHILDRGNYDSPTDPVYPNMPKSILPFTDEYPKNRIGLAKWITNKDNPLTPRVAVNRYWQNLFGRGIVNTSEDFGNQGELPSHPKLLDWLSREFVNSGWDVKKLHKTIMLSNTYQQSSVVSAELIEKDIDNKWIARGPSNRLTGEMMRDNALYASGLMLMEVGGESVYPYQPPGLWKVSGGKYEEDDTPEGLYRRSMYTIWKRSVPNPTISTFDAPTRELCTSRRQKTNTPLQALVTLNDPTYIEASRVLGKQISEADSIQEGISETFMKLTGRSISDQELALLYKLQQTEYEKFNKNIEKTKGWLNSGRFKIDETDDKALIAANAVVASTIMNTDATITKR